MIEIIYKDGGKEDITKLFSGLINIDNYHYTMLMIANLDCVDYVKISEVKSPDKWTREIGKTKYVGKTGENVSNSSESR